MIPSNPEERAISAAITLLDGDLDHQNAETMRDMLSKLRAPVADERAAFVRHVSGRDDLELYQVENVIDANLTRWATWRAARDYYQQARAALASAPVADEPDDLSEAYRMAKDDRAMFPASTMRKMWELKERYRLALASAPVAGMKPLEPEFAKVLSDNFDSLMVRLPSESAPVAGDDGALSAQNRPESRANTGSTGGALTPVAGEAVAEVQIDPHSPPDDERAIIVPLVDFEAVDAGTKLYAAPQASAVGGEAVAWRYWNEKSNSWNTTTSAVVADVMRESGRAVEPLFAAPQASEAVRSYRDSDDFHNNASNDELGTWQRGWDDCREASEAVRDALVPFAALEDADLIGTAFEGKGDDAEILHFHRTGKSVTLGDFRRARAALASAPVAGEAQSEVAKLAEELGDLASDMAYEANQEMDQDKASRAALIERGERALRRFADAAPQASEAVRNPAAERDTGKDRLSFHIWALVHGMDITPNDSCGYVSPLTQRAWMRWNPPESAALSAQPGAQATSNDGGE